MIIVTVTHNQGAYTDDGGNIIVATVGAPSDKPIEEIKKEIHDAWDEFQKTEPDMDSQFEAFLMSEYVYVPAKGKQSISASITVSV